MSVLALSMSAITGTLYANDQVAQTEAEVQNTTVVSDASTESVVTSTDSVQEASTTPATDVVTTEPAPVEAANTGANQAATALQKKEGDATQETNLQEVFTSNERQYSLIKRGVFSAYYDLDYTYYRDTRIDLALADDSSLLMGLNSVVRQDTNPDDNVNDSISVNGAKINLYNLLAGQNSSNSINLSDYENKTARWINLYAFYQAVYNNIKDISPAPTDAEKALAQRLSGTVSIKLANQSIPACNAIKTKS